LLVLRCDLPFRQERPHGPPSPANASHDQEGLLRAVTVLKGFLRGRVFLGGHSYGGRQASMLAASEASLVAGMLLLSYPLHPPKRPLHTRTSHFPQLNAPTLFVHGTHDPFGSIAEMESAIGLIPAQTVLLPVQGVGHSLISKRNKVELSNAVVGAFRAFSAVAA
jgi:uncharacterized protein